MQGAYYTGKYRNRFEELGYSAEEINERKNKIFETIFHGPEDERFYHEFGEDMAYMEDTGNHDARTEGMSYGMMMCVQMDKKDEFDRLWRWSKKYMYMESGNEAGYFAWSVSPEGVKNAQGAAPDGEEFFITALFMASRRWGDGEGILNYRAEAEKLLDACINNEHRGLRSMWDPSNKLIRFVANFDFSDPSYHLPHFYTFIADQTSNEENRKFMLEAAKASRDFLSKACHPVTGLNPEYSKFDGTPIDKPWFDGNCHQLYYSDAYRTGANIALDYSWFGADERELKQAENQIRFFCETLGKQNWDGIYDLDGTVMEGKALHPVAIIATNAQVSLNLESEDAEYCIRKFWDTPLRKGDRRYYDNCLYFFAFLALSGSYRAEW